MNYKLAKELKYAGFPQTYKFGDKFYRFDEKTIGIVTGHTPDKVIDGCECDVCYPTAGNMEPYTKIPTLEELIDACGDREKQFELRRKGNGWVASDFFRGGREVWGNGKTPIEAVAKLYIALNKK